MTHLNERAKVVCDANAANPMVLVKWHDARFYSGTHGREEIQGFKMAVFESLGYLVSRDATTTIIAAEYNDEGQHRDVTLIPTGTILSIRRLTPGPLV